eukprot:CAMPEP_0172202658 /NCGR_PEP_ID=MMETSP1050-20130122/30796_1 /TAXON_ID=233186 /ORGANISM="Cryptomonas curvata, Strain CCAP979/52" /LENGTH=244 /DNA_ID=CAMNT_0012880677 /DNA_START=80 /DNA_END=810 /DNA_ORIENTATION=-
MALRMGQSFSIKRSDSTNQLLKNTELPPEKDWEADHSLSMLMLDGTWQSRQMVWTKALIYFIRTADKAVVDTIPLNEIVSVASINKNLKRKRTLSMISISSSIENTSVQEPGKIQKDSESSSILGKLQRAPSSDPSDAIIQIKTIPEGFNSGRTYHLQADSEEQGSAIASQLEKISKDVKHHAEAKSRFQKSQEKVKAIYCSLPFQTTIAILIISNFIINAAEAQLAGAMSTPDGQLTAAGAAL